MTATFQINFENTEQVNKLLVFLHNLKVNFKFTQSSTQEISSANDFDDEWIINGKTLLPLLDQNTAFNFLKQEEEDIYSDSDLRVKY